MSKKRRGYSFLEMLLRSMTIQLKAVPVHTTIAIFICMAQGIIYALSVNITQILFDAITSAAGGQIGFMDCLIPLVILAGVTFGQQIINGVHHLHFVLLFGKSRGKMKSTLYKKLQQIDPSYFEDTDFLDDLNKAKEGTHCLPYFATVPFLILFFYGFYLLTIGTYLYNLKPMLLVTIILAFIPALLAQVARAKVFTKLEEDIAPIRREFEYYQRTLCDREYFKETRILGAFQYFCNLFHNTILLVTDKVWKAKRKSALVEMALNISTFAGMAIASYLLFTATMSGEITIGAFAAVFSALGMLFQVMQEIVCIHIGNMNEDVGKVSNLIRILDLPERTGIDNKNLDFSKGVVAKNISFTYPGRLEPAVENVSLNIADGETIAIVGDNGAGKSTLVRLLTGVYNPTEGIVTIGGLQTSETFPKAIYKGISCVFQKYQKYKMTLEENITISDIEKEVIHSNIDKALREADFDSSNIDYDTMLSPEFDGIDLSGGQWQRLAIARGLYRTNGFIVLDEPTAAIDPILETKIYKQFKRFAEGKCAVLVTHRLGAAKLADRIVVMDNGKIINIGKHDELLSQHGKYADMWAAQAQWYKREFN